MRTQGIYINVSRRNDDLPRLIEEYSFQVEPPFVESLKPMISNPIDGAPPEGMKPVPAGALQRAAQMTNMSMFNSR